MLDEFLRFEETACRWHPCCTLPLRGLRHDPRCSYARERKLHLIQQVGKAPIGRYWPFRLISRPTTVLLFCAKLLLGRATLVFTRTPSMRTGHYGSSWPFTLIFILGALPLLVDADIPWKSLGSDWSGTRDRAGRAQSRSLMDVAPDEATTRPRRDRARPYQWGTPIRAVVVRQKYYLGRIDKGLLRHTCRLV